MAKIWIDGKSFEVDHSKNLLETILNLGFDLPYFCWHPALGSVGSCRQCAIKKYWGEDHSQGGQIVMACMEPAADGLHLSVKDGEASEFRERVIEWLMLNHPHDCPICDEGGECHLQDMTVMAGHTYRRSRFKKRTYNNQDLGPCINHEMNRCIQCYRCVRFYNDYAGGDDLQVFSAHDHVYFGRHEDGTLESEFSGNLVEVCPTGVFTDKTLKEHYTRKWDLTSAPSVCQHCSLGCNTLAGERYGSLRRILNRFNPEVNGYFLCDRGRFGYDFVNDQARIRQSQVLEAGQSKILDPAQVLQQLETRLHSGKVMGIGSPRASLESNYLLRELVGKEHFYNGTMGRHNKIHQTALRFLQEGPVRTPSLKEIESCDAVIVIGEDLTNTAPRMDLALNQSVRLQPMEQLDKVGIPDWNDGAAREHIQQQRGPLYVLTPAPTKLDRIAAGSVRESPEGITKLVQALTHELDGSVQNITDSESQKDLVTEIAKALSSARRPLVIAGSSLGSLDMVKAAINLAMVLHQSNHQAAISFVFPECNSLGVGMLEPRGLGNAMVSPDKYDTLVILENDLYRRASKSLLDKFLDNFNTVVVLDHTGSGTTARADMLLAAGTFAESEGTLVNNEGRAQRFFQVQASDKEVQESWRWLLQIGKQLNRDNFHDLNGLDDIILKIEQQLPQFSGISKAAHPANYRLNGQKITREPHRYSGRTAMFADRGVSEPRPPKDEDSPLSYTMEGYQGIPPASATAFYWSPGWNSVQSLNKFRNEITQGRQAEEPGFRLLEPAQGKLLSLFDDKIEEESSQQKWKVVPLPHIFGSDEFSSKSEAIQGRCPQASVTLNKQQAEQLNISDQGQVTILVEDMEVSLKANLAAEWREDHLGIPVGFPGMPYMEVNTVIQLKDQQDAD